ncbi:Cysteine-rich, acidic integral membrane protein, partial [Termitomyces sp. T112]
MKEEKVKKKKKKNRKGKKKKVRGVEERVEEEGAEIDATVEQEKEKVGRKERDAEETNEIDVMDEGEVEVEQAKGNTGIKEEIEEEECENKRVENIGEMGGEPDTDEVMSDIGEFEDALDEIIATPTVPFADEEPNAVHVVDEAAFDAEIHANINTEMNSETAMEETEVGKVMEVDEPIENASREQSDNDKEDLGQDS